MSKYCLKIFVIRVLFLFEMVFCFNSYSQIISQSDSLSRKYYQEFNRAKVGFKHNYRSISYCFNFYTYDKSPEVIPNLLIALYDDKRKELACLIDSSGNLLMDSVGIHVVFFNNHAIVLKNNKIGTINHRAKLITPFICQACNDFDVYYNPFDDIVLKAGNYDFIYQIVCNTFSFYRRYGVVNCDGKLLVDTIYDNQAELLSIDNNKLNKDLLLTNDTSLALINYQTGNILFKKWTKDNYLLSMPFKYMNKQFYVYGDRLTNCYGLLDDRLNVILENKFNSIFVKVFADAAISKTADVYNFCETLLYSELRNINNSYIEKSFNSNDSIPNINGINLPKYIFITQNKKVGIFNLEKFQIDIPCKYDDIYKNEKGEITGFLAGKKEEYINLD